MVFSSIHVSIFIKPDKQNFKILKKLIKPKPNPNSVLSPQFDENHVQGYNHYDCQLCFVIAAPTSECLLTYHPVIIMCNFHIIIVITIPNIILIILSNIDSRVHLKYI